MTGSEILSELYDSEAAFAAYIANVRMRRSDRRIDRERKRLRACADDLLAEIAGALDDGDEDIVSELQAVLDEFERRIELISTLQSDPSQPESVPAPASLAQQSSSFTDNDATPCIDDLTSTASLTVPLVHPPVIDGPDYTSAINVLDALISTQSEEEVACRRAEIEHLRAQLTELNEAWKALDESGLTSKGGFRNRARFFRLRAIVCRAGEIHTTAIAHDMGDGLAADAVELRDRIDLARQYATDPNQCLPFAEIAWDPSESPLFATAWSDLARYYDQVAHAEEAWQWYLANKNSVPRGLRFEFVNSIGAVQQLLFRKLDEYKGSDGLQSELYIELRREAEDVGFLTSLHPDASLKTLEKCAASLPEEYEQIKRQADQEREKSIRAARRQAAVEAVTAWQSRTHLHVSTDFDQAMREELYGLLDECLASGVAPTNPSVRSALLDRAYLVLEGEPRFGKLLNAVLEERKRCGMDGITSDPQPEEDEITDFSDSTVSEYLEAVQPFTIGKRILILGGTPRERGLRIETELKQLLGCFEVKWVPSKKSDRATKFQADIKRADILLLAKNYAGHDMSEMGRDWIREAGGHFIHLLSGYGINQLVYQLYRYVKQKGAHD